MITYQVEYKDATGEWVQTGTQFKNYSDALDRLKEENLNDPEYAHRIVQNRMVSTVLSVLVGQRDLEENV